MVPSLLIGEFHYIIIVSRFIVSPHVQDIDEPRMILRDLLVVLDALELTLEGPLVFKILPSHHFNRTVHPGNRTSKIHLPISSSADAAENLEVGDQRTVG